MVGRENDRGLGADSVWAGSSAAANRNSALGKSSRAAPIQNNKRGVKPAAALRLAARRTTRLTANQSPLSCVLQAKGPTRLLPRRDRPVVFAAKLNRALNQGRV
ncbi:hypothetical protein JANAI62_09870 [Jannaschia pagri]|uniref:Uncharacterized protein n=1 Tax=Jannaschia pagri TaxID=2829797 RepID=A0ABQ4NJI9_9RHOB|nr:hypothetical protein JANAI61_09900 [Jannaschia sp. AI_61]GIT94364.1 hypothetical protein JANAI62_09870 [Jannaschia sp. AI_62]